MIMLDRRQAVGILFLCVLGLGVLLYFFSGAYTEFEPDNCRANGGWVVETERGGRGCAYPPADFKYD